MPGWAASFLRAMEASLLSLVPRDMIEVFALPNVWGQPLKYKIEVAADVALLGEDFDAHERRGQVLQ